MLKGSNTLNFSRDDYEKFTSVEVTDCVPPIYSVNSIGFFIFYLEY